MELQKCWANTKFSNPMYFPSRLCVCALFFFHLSRAFLSVCSGNMSVVRVRIFWCSPFHSFILFLPMNSVSVHFSFSNMHNNLHVIPIAEQKRTYDEQIFSRIWYQFIHFYTLFDRNGMHSPLQPFGPWPNVIVFGLFVYFDCVNKIIMKKKTNREKKEKILVENLMFDLLLLIVNKRKIECSLNNTKIL